MTHCWRRFASCRYKRYAQIEPVVSNIRQSDSGVHGICTASPLPCSTPLLLHSSGQGSRSAHRSAQV